jgi:hypothetical protein
MTSLYPRFPQPYSCRRDRGLTIVELRVAYTRYPTESTDRYSPATVIKWNRLTGTADTKAPFPSELGIITVLVFLLASLATCH